MKRFSDFSFLFSVKIAMLFLIYCSGCVSNPSVSKKPHHASKGFKNIYLKEENTFADFLKWRWDALFLERPARESYNFTMAQNDSQYLITNENETTFTWIGHATALLQLAGQNILTDPVFAQRASPVQWAGPKRVVEPGLAISRLPPIHVVLISHDHYDALNEPSILELYNRPEGKNTVFFVPLGLKKWFLDRGISNVVEMDWWDLKRHGPLEISATPVQHWSKRTPFSKNETLWAGWVVQAGDFSFFFAGDSGYCPHFKTIGEKFGPINLAAIPIGAYEPRWFMAKHHMNPEESVRVHRDIGAKKSVAIHWGTFILTDEPLTEPPKRLEKAKKEAGLAENAFVVLKHGQTLKEPDILDFD